MTLRRTLAVASVVMLVGVSTAAAQFPPPPGQNAAAGSASPFPPAPGQLSPFPPAGQASPGGQGGSVFPPPPGAKGPLPPAVSAAPPAQGSPFAPPGQQQQSRSACEGFVPLREAAEKGAMAIKAASERKASREEVCPLFKNFAAAEGKMVRFLEQNRSQCGIPADAVKQAKGNHGRTIQIRNNVCAAGPAARGPSLSDALGGPLISSDPPKPGRGTFDTLTGPLQR